MSVETATYISDLNASYPASGDPKSEGDNHLRLLKSTVKATFPNVAGAVTPTHTELNYVDGVTSAIQDQLNRTLRQSGGSAVNALPDAATRASKVLSFDASGHPATSIAVVDLSNAVTAASNAATSETNAAASASAAAGSASTASTHASNASTSASNASSSASAASTSASNAATSASTATTQAGNAATSASNAASSASAASTSASNASSSATTAGTHATNAGNSATAAATSASDAAASYDAFDDRYLGSKAANPSVDNDGAALLTGALYFNTSVNEMRVWNGSAWLTAYNPATGALTSSGYTMSTARLIGRTTASTGATEEITVGSGLSLSAGTLSASASATLTISNKTGAYTVVAGDNGTVINCTSGTFAVSLTAAATLGSGFNVQIWNTGTGAITIDPNASEVIDTQDVFTSFKLNTGTGVTLVCTGSGWKMSATGTGGGGFGSVQLGMNAKSGTGQDTIAIGRDSAAGITNAYGVAVGASTSAGGIGSVAIGSAASAASNYSVAIGKNSSNQASVTATGAGAVALGGSYASGTDSFAAAIGNNTSTYGAQGTSSIAMGQQAKATAQSAICLSTSGGCHASGQYSVVFGGGWQGASLAAGIGSYAFGMDAVSNQAGKYAYASKGIAAAGDAQYGLIVLKASTTGSTVVMTSDAAAASTTNQLIAASNQAMAFTGTLIGKQTGSANIAAYEIKGTLVNNAGTVTMPTGTLTLIGTDSIGLTTAPTIAADNTNKGIAITSGAKTATNIRWVATIRSSELTYA